MDVAQGLTSVVTATELIVNAGNLFETMPYNGQMRLLVTGDATGAGMLTVYAGSRVIMPSSRVSLAARFPIDPDDVLVPSANVRAGEKIAIAFRAGGAGTSVLYWRYLLRRAMMR